MNVRESFVKVLLACSGHKHRHLKRGRADEIYVGTLFRVGLRWAHENEAEVHILSARYGWIRDSTVIDTYDRRLTAVSTVTPPAGPGVYLGGRDYFDPEFMLSSGFKPLVESGPIGVMIQHGTALLRNPELVGGTLRRMKTHGVTWYIAEWLKQKPRAKEELLDMLQVQFPDRERRAMAITVGCQLRQDRMGAERNGVLSRLPDGRYSFKEN